MVTMGSWEVRILEDGWTAVTQDGSLAAHFEHTVAVTENGPEVLTSLTGRSVPTAPASQGR
jgi:methionyl aminopeptidase